MKKSVIGLLLRNSVPDTHTKSTHNALQWRLRTHAYIPYHTLDFAKTFFLFFFKSTGTRTKETINAHTHTRNNKLELGNELAWDHAFLVLLFRTRGFFFWHTRVLYIYIRVYTCILEKEEKGMKTERRVIIINLHRDAVTS